MTIKYVVALLILSAAMVCAQSRETPVYLEEFQNLNASVDRITSEIVHGEIPSSTPSRVFALQKLVHRLQEEAGRADGEARKQSGRPDKRLLLIEQGCVAMDYVLQAVASFIDTDGRIFLSLAADGKRAVAAITKVL